MKEGGVWTWKVPEKPDFCKKFPEHEKCRQEPKPDDGTLESLKKQIIALDEEVDGLQMKMKQQKKLLKQEGKKRRKARTDAQREEIETRIDAIQDEINATRIAGKKAQRKLRFLEDEYNRRSRFPPPFQPVY